METSNNSDLCYSKELNGWQSSLLAFKWVTGGRQGRIAKTPDSAVSTLCLVYYSEKSLHDGEELCSLLHTKKKINEYKSGSLLQYEVLYSK